MDTKTVYTIDRIEYTVESRSSETAVDTLHEKIEKLLIRDIRHSAGQSDFHCKNIGQNVEKSEF